MFSGHMWVIIGAAIFLLGFVSFNIQLYQLIKLDAQARGMDHPEIWGLSASGRSGIVGLHHYFVQRRDYPAPRSQELAELQKKKRLALLYLIIGLLGGLLMTIASLPSKG